MLLVFLTLAVEWPVLLWESFCVKQPLLESARGKQNGGNRVNIAISR